MSPEVEKLNGYGWIGISFNRKLARSSMSTMFRGLFEGYAIMPISDGRLQTFSVDVFRLVIFVSYLGNR